MKFSRQSSFTPIGEIVAQQLLPQLRVARKLPLRISCFGTSSHHGGDDTDGVDRTVVLGERPSPEDAMVFASRWITRDDFRIGSGDTPCFIPHIMAIQDSEHGLVLAAEIRAGIILWQQPVASDAEARRIVTEASRLRGLAFRASGDGDHASARQFRHRASLLEARLVDPFWRETAADLLNLPRAA